MKNKMNEMQIKAVTSKGKFIVIIAGAGSGKTTVLTKRISYLYAQNNVDPQSVLAITFTNKAAKEMKDRLVESDGPYANMSTIVTFHSFAVKILRENANLLKRHDENFKIIDEDDKKKIIKNLLKENQFDEEYTVKNILNVIGYAKTFATSLIEVEFKIAFDYMKIYKLYDEFCKENNLFDFDDLLLYAHHLLKKKELQQKYINKYKYILIDEFQDTSEIQYDILKKIIAPETSVFIVGDIDQSIYSWRGAIVENMLNLQKNHDNIEMIKLEQNYRSSKKILKHANNLISYNKQRLDKNLWTDDETVSDIEYTSFNTTQQEATYVAKKIEKLLEQNHEMNEISILYRSNYQSRKIEELLIKNHIPYTIYGGLRFYERMEIKDILCYIRLIVDNKDVMALERVINVPRRKIGDKTFLKYKTFARDNTMSIFEAIKSIGSTKAVEFVSIIEKYANNFEEDLETNFDNLLKDIKYFEYLNDYDSATYDDRVRNITELKESLLNNQDQSLVDYLNDLMLYSEKEEIQAEHVILSTVHGVKGLEFETVFLIGLNQGKFPLERTLNELEELEEERRLGYVALTRAKKNIYISSTKFDFRGEFTKPSMFIEEMEIETANENDDFFDFFV